MRPSPNTRARFSAEMIEGCICLTDLHGPVSITNDIEAVVVELGRQGFLINSWPIIYRDNQNHYDEVVVDNGQFRAFNLLGEPDQLRAIALAHSFHETRIRSSSRESNTGSEREPVPPAHLEAFTVFMDECNVQYSDMPDGAWCALMTEFAQRYLETVLKVPVHQARDLAHDAWLQWVAKNSTRGQA